jgi:hypothetical protein
LERGTDVTDWRRMSDMFALDNLTVGVFASLPPANIQSLLGKFNRLPVKRGDTIIKQGDPGDFYYLIESGRCKVTRKVAGSSIELAELKEGNAFGEEALVADTARNATVVMKTDGVLLRLSKDDFNELLRAPLAATGRSAREAAAGIEWNGAVWIDVRFPAEYRSDGFPGALNIPLDDIRQAVRRRSIRRRNTSCIVRRDVAAPPRLSCFPNAASMLPARGRHAGLCGCHGVSAMSAAAAAESASDVDIRLAFFKNLQVVTNKVHATANIDEIMLELSGEICSLFNADRLTIYTVGDDKASIVSKVKTGLNSFKDLRLPIADQSIAGHVALAKKTVNIRDVYDDAELKAINPSHALPPGS